MYLCCGMPSPTKAPKQHSTPTAFSVFMTAGLKLANSNHDGSLDGAVGNEWQHHAPKLPPERQDLSKWMAILRCLDFALRYLVFALRSLDFTLGSLNFAFPSMDINRWCYDFTLRFLGLAARCLHCTLLIFRVSLPSSILTLSPPTGNPSDSLCDRFSKGL